MKVLGISLGRLRTGLSVVNRKGLEPIGGPTKTFAIPPSSSKATLIRHSDFPLWDQSKLIIQEVASLVDHGSSDELMIGILKTPPISSRDGYISESDLQNLKLHAVVSHEVHRNFGIIPLAVTIHEARSVSPSSEAEIRSTKQNLIRCFNDNVKEKPESTTSSSSQVMSEAWGVAMFLERNRLLREMREIWPDLVERMKSEVSRRKLYANNEATKIHPEILDELVNSEVNKSLRKRFKI